ncbi:MAG TPA: MBL fold metallo-hydrolase [Terracidiphilus sp.]|nr:MBL fold metallo-hydrolase [Terracidiphilus sp.]
MHIPWLYAQGMVRFTVLASGSKGNATVVSGGRTRILVDCGLSCRELFRRMKLAGEEPETLDAIVITHEHSDHVGGLAVTARKLNIPVYFTEGTHRAWMRWLTPRRQMTYAQWLEQIRKQAAERQAEADAAEDEGEPDESDLVEAVEDGQENEPQVPFGSLRAGFRLPSAKLRVAQDDSKAGARVDEPVNTQNASETVEAQGESEPAKEKDPSWLPAVEYFQAGEPFEIGEIDLSPFTIPHDAADPVGFVFRAEGVGMGYATDLGYIPPNVKAQLRDLDLLLLESNHDLEMLRDGPYPWAVKQRVLSRVGHLSNEAAAEFLENGYDGQAAYVILAHLSESNNLPELARVTAERALNGRASLLANMLLLAKQHEPLSSIYF